MRGENFRTIRFFKAKKKTKPYVVDVKKYDIDPTGFVVEPFGFRS